jgi:hypothetical protein
MKNGTTAAAPNTHPVMNPTVLMFVTVHLCRKGRNSSGGTRQADPRRAAVDLAPLGSADGPLPLRAARREHP